MSLLFLAALRLETGVLRTVLENPSTSREGGYHCLSGHVGGVPVKLARTGVGASRAERAADALLGSSKPDLVVCYGFAGGLRPTLMAGDLILATEVLDGRREGVAVRYFPDPGFFAKALAALDGQGGAYPGLLFTSERPLASRDDKAKAFERTGAAAVDMETACIAGRCDETGVPFIALRAVSDPQELAIPRRLRGLLSPWHARRSLRLVRGVQAARQRLRTALAALPPALYPGA